MSTNRDWGWRELEYLAWNISKYRTAGESCLDVAVRRVAEGLAFPVPLVRFLPVGQLAERLERHV